MHTTGCRIQTAITVKDAAELFQIAADRSRGAGSRMASVMGNRVQFFEPRDDSPFSQFNQNDDDFCVGVHIPKFVGGGAAGGATRTVQMTVWDRGSHREIMFISPHKMTEGSGAKKLIRSFVDTFSQVDPHLTVLD